MRRLPPGRFGAGYATAIGLGGAASGIAIGLILDVAIFGSFVGRPSVISGLGRATAGLFVAACTAVIVTGLRLKRSAHHRSGLFLMAAGTALLLMTSPCTILILAGD